MVGQKSMESHPTLRGGGEKQGKRRLKGPEETSSAVKPISSVHFLQLDAASPASTWIRKQHGCTPGTPGPSPHGKLSPPSSSGVPHSLTGEDGCLP